MGNFLTAFAQFFTPRIVHRGKNIPNTAVSDLSVLQPNDRLIFEALCQFIWIQGDPLPLIFDVQNEIYTKKGITRSTLARLEQLDLIVFEDSGFVKKGYGKHTRLFYGGKPTKIGFQVDADNYLDLGHVLLTECGKKLALAFKAPRNQSFYEYVIGRWHQQGLLLSSIQVDRNHNVEKINCTCSIKE